MQPAPAAKLWPVPAIETTAALADWLWLEPEELACYADLKQLSSRSHDEALCHYRLAFRVKQSGGVRFIEAPKPRLKALQCQVLGWLLAAIPALRAKEFKGFSVQQVTVKLLRIFWAACAQML